MRIHFTGNNLLEIIYWQTEKSDYRKWKLSWKSANISTRNEPKRNRILTDQWQKNVYVLKWKNKVKKIVKNWLYLCERFVQFESTILFCRWIKLCMETQTTERQRIEIFKCSVKEKSINSHRYTYKYTRY